MFISVIVTTYNRPDALAMVLNGFAEQDQQNFEVIIADDGSTPETKQWLETIIVPFPLHHVWHEDRGFRAAMIRNKAVAKAKGDYLIFVDGDCIPQKHFIRRHQHLARQGCFVAGNRLLLSESFTQYAIGAKLPLHRWRWSQWFAARCQQHCNRLLPLIYLPFMRWRRFRAAQWRGAKTCNLAMWRSDFIAVNGFDEAYVGWGYEDSDLVIRLLRYQVQRIEGRFAVPVLHLWHPENTRKNEKENLLRLQKQADSAGRPVRQGVCQYL